MNSCAGPSPGRFVRAPRNFCEAAFVLARVCRFGLWLLALSCFVSGERLAVCETEGTVSETIRQHEYDLSTQGRVFLLKEAGSASFFMLGELHGEKEIPALLRMIWPPMWQAGYRHIAAELSPWAANRLEFRPPGASEPIRGLWSQAEATFAASFNRGRGAVLWGCDIEEAQPNLPIRDLAAANPGNRNLQSALEMTRLGYRRSMARELLQRLREATGVKDLFAGGVSLRSNILRTLEIEIARLGADTRLEASIRREALMKELFYRHWQSSPQPKVLLRFGRNHLHRGYDRRGVSTLGNFVAELAVARGLQAFNVAAFAAGGRIYWSGQLLEADERKDDPALEFLASLAQYPATVFDLRPIRQALHRIPEIQRSLLEASLVYWADSYDAILCYREVTPIPH